MFVSNIGLLVGCHLNTTTGCGWISALWRRCVAKILIQTYVRWQQLRNAMETIGKKQNETRDKGFSVSLGQKQN